MKPFSKIIAVFGSSAISQDSPDAEQAYTMGKLLAETQFKISNGGYCGAMESASRGAVEAGGKVVGVISQVFSHRVPNQYLTETVETADLLERIETLMRISDGYVVLDGGIGTLAELFIAWNMLATGWDKPVIVVGNRMKQALDDIRMHTEIEEKHLRLLHFCPTVDEAVKQLKKAFEQ